LGGIGPCPSDFIRSLTTNSARIHNAPMTRMIAPAMNDEGRAVALGGSEGGTVAGGTVTVVLQSDLLPPVSRSVTVTEYVPATEYR